MFNRRRRIRAARSLICALLLGAAASIPMNAASAQTPVPFYKNKTLTIIVGFSPAGLYDIIARTLARHMGSHIPGNPTIVVQNEPGGSNALLTVYSTAPKDGTVIGMVARNYPIDRILSKSVPAYDPMRLNPIGSTSPDPAVAVTWHTSPVKTFNDLFHTSITVGATAYVDNTGRYPLVAKNLTGANIKIVTGYPGGNDVTTAIERGEVDGTFGWSWGSLKSRGSALLENKQVNIIMQLGVEKARDLPDTPSIMDYAKTDLDRNALNLLFLPQAFAWPFVAPPELPPDRLSILRTAFDETMKDEGFLADAAKLHIEVQPMGGADIASLVRKISSYDHSVTERVQELLAIKE